MAIDAVVRQVHAPTDEPLGPWDAGRAVQDALERCRELDPEVLHDGVPEPLHVVDRPAPELVDRLDAVLAHEARDVRVLDVIGRRLPGYFGHGARWYGERA